MTDISKTLDGKITGGHMLARALKAKGVERVFALCGGFINPIFMGCMDYGIEVIGTRNEMEAGFLAAATARLTREVSVCIGEPSGFTNYVSAVAEAYYAGDPVIFISASSNSNNFDNAGFKEMPQPEVVKCMTKYAIEVNDGQRIGWFLDKAFDIAINHPTGPVQLSIPTNLLFSGAYAAKPKEGARSFDPARKKVHQPCPNPADLDEIEEILKKAKKPAIIAGPGVWYSHAESELEEFSSRHKIPTFVPLTHIKLINMSHEYNMGLIDYHQNPCSRLVGEEADVVLFLGGRLDFPVNFGMAPLFNQHTTMISVNPTAREAANNMLCEMRMVSDIKMFLQALNKRSDPVKSESDWAERIRERRRETVEAYQDVLTSDAQPVHPLRLCYDALNSLGENDIMVIDGGDISAWFEIAINCWAMQGKKIKGIISPGPWEQMGTGPAFATAAKMASPSSHVVLVTGDGSLGLAPGLTPMETAIHNNLAVTMMVANNAQWGMIQEQQKAMWGRTVATSLRDVDYHKIFEGAGAFSQLVKTPNDIVPAIQKAKEKNAPAFIEVKTQGVMSPITQGLVEMRTRTAIE